MLHDVDFGEVADRIRDAAPVPLLLSVIAATLTFPLRTIRWRYLLRLEGATLPFTPLWHATAIGFMANNVLPARAGEVVRAYAARKLTGVRFSTAFASVAVERMLDGIVLVGMLVVAAFAGGFSADTTVGGVTVGQVAVWAGAVFGGLLLVALVVVQRPALMVRLARRIFGVVLPSALADRMGVILEGLVAGLDALGTPSRAFAAFFWSVVVWSTYAVSFWFGFVAFDVAAPWSATLMLQALIAFGVALPSAPGFFGIFEGVSRAALALYGVAAGQAVSFAIGYHVATFIPITLLGLWSLWATSLRLAELRGGER